MFEDAADGAGADGHGALAKFLGDGLGGGVGVEEAVSNDLTDDFGGSAGGFLGTSRCAVKSGGSAFLKGVEELEVALFGKAVLTRGGGGSEAETLALDEHEEFVGDFVAGVESESPLIAAEGVGGRIELEHGRVSRTAKWAAVDQPSLERRMRGAAPKVK